MNKRVSVIIAVRNNQTGINRLLALLSEQTLPADQFEVIIVDNGSRTAIKADGENIRIITETRRANAFLARNTGMATAQADVFAFIDSDCRPQPDWLEKGLQALGDSGLAAGAIRFDLPPRPTTAQLLDSILYLQQDQCEARGMAATANLFVQRAVYDKIGDMPTGNRFAGDSLFCKKAVLAGFELRYAPHAVIDHPARRLHPLLHKAFWTGTGVAYRTRLLGSRPNDKNQQPMLHLLNYSIVQKKLAERGHADRALRVWLLVFVVIGYGLLGYWFERIRSVVFGTPDAK